jgi:hypothetical protein
MAEQYHDGAEVVKPPVLHGGFPVPESVEVAARTSTNFSEFKFCSLFNAVMLFFV